MWKDNSQIFKPQIQKIIYKILKNSIYQLNEINFKQEFKSNILELVVQKKSEEYISSEEITILSKKINYQMDLFDVINEPYNLVVISAGFEKQLKTLVDYKNYLGKYISITLKKTINDLKTIEGYLKNIDKENRIIIVEYLIKTSKKIIDINFKNVKYARLAYKF